MHQRAITVHESLSPSEDESNETNLTTGGWMEELKSEIKSGAEFIVELTGSFMSTP